MTEITKRAWHVGSRFMMVIVCSSLVSLLRATYGGPAQTSNVRNQKKMSHHLYSGAGTVFMIRAITSSVASPCVIKRTDKTAGPT